MDLSERGAGVARHPWELARLAAYRGILQRHGALGAERVLDVGAGDGWFSETLAAALPDASRIVCWDVNYNELELRTEDPRVERTTSAPTAAFDLVLCLDVLEHLPDPDRFVAEQLHLLAAPGAHVLVAVPAHPSLFGAHDRALGHVRRYRRHQLLDTLRDWVEVIEHGPLFSVLVPPRAAAVAAERLAARLGRPPAAGQHGVGAWQHGRLLTSGVRGALAADTAVTRLLGPVGRRLPGLSVWAYGRAR